jgi:hypothetical protein
VTDELIVIVQYPYLKSCLSCPHIIMQSLLRWSIENSAPADTSASTRPQKPIDTGLIDFLLGPSPAQQMEDALAVATDKTTEEGEDEDDEGEDSKGRKATRMQALSNLEMVKSFLLDILEDANGENS